MCTGGRFVADFMVGTPERPEVPEVVEECLTATADGTWVVWANKVARRVGDRFAPLTGDDPYPADAMARCRRGESHAAPQPHCTCGFHALSGSLDVFHAVGLPMVQLDVALSGRVLAYEWESGGLLFRAARQTVARVRELDTGWDPPPTPPPPEPGGRLARLVQDDPRGEGPLRLALPRSAPSLVSLSDDAGYCVASRGTALAWPLTAAPAPALA